MVSAAMGEKHEQVDTSEKGIRFGSEQPSARITAYRAPCSDNDCLSDHDD